MARRDRQPGRRPGGRPDRRPVRRPDVAPAIRLTDAERDQAMARLSEHFAVGRLDKEEFDERSDAIWSARTGADLEPIFVDLEQPPGRSGPPWYQQLPVVPLVIVALIALTIFTHVPFIALAFFGFFVFGRHGRRW